VNSKRKTDSRKETLPVAKLRLMLYELRSDNFWITKGYGIMLE